MRNISNRNGIGKAAPRNANPDQSMYFPATKHRRIPMLPKAVGSSPSVPRTSGCTVSPKYTGKDNDATPTENPDKARPVIDITL